MSNGTDRLRSTKTALRAAREGRTLRALAVALGYEPHKAGFLSDVLKGREHVNRDALEDLRRRLGLDWIEYREEPVVHGAGKPKRQRPPYKRPTWTMVREMEAEIARLREALGE